MTNHEITSSDNSDGALCRVATLSNVLAKQLTGPARTLAYRIKAEALSELILRGDAYVNGVRPGGIIALSLTGDPPVRVHIRESHLTPAARHVAIDQARTAPAVAPIGESVHGGLPCGWKRHIQIDRRKR